MSYRSDFDNLLKRLRVAGWRIERTARNHWRLVPPDPTLPAVITGGTPSDHRAWKNLLAQLRRSGFVLKRGRIPKAPPEAPEGETPPPRPSPPELEEQPTGAAPQIDLDLLALDRALAALADVEDIAKRYRVALATLKGLM